MNELLDQVQDSDPEFARTIRRLRWASRGLAAAIVVALGAGLWAVVVNGRQGDQITQIQRSPCTAHPAGAACARIRQRVARAEPISNPCISYQRVTGIRGRECPRMLVRDASGRAPAPRPATPVPPPPASEPATAPARGEHGLDGSAPAAAGTGGAGGEQPPSPSPGGDAPQPVPPEPVAPAPTVTPATAPESPQPSPEGPEPLVPAVIEPVLEAVCSVADRLADICD